MPGDPNTMMPSLVGTAPSHERKGLMSCLYMTCTIAAGSAAHQIATRHDIIMQQCCTVHALSTTSWSRRWWSDQPECTDTVQCGLVHAKCMYVQWLCAWPVNHIHKYLNVNQWLHNIMLYITQQIAQVTWYYRQDTWLFFSWEWSGPPD